jgi:hypothetical protein
MKIKTIDILSIRYGWQGWVASLWIGVGFLFAAQFGYNFWKGLIYIAVFVIPGIELARIDLVRGAEASDEHAVHH